MNRAITIAICFFITLVLGVGFLWPKYQDLKSLQEEISQKKAELQYKEEYFLNLNNLSAQLQKYSDNLSKIDSALPADPSLPALFGFLQKTSSESGLVLKRMGQVTSSPLKEKPGLQEHWLDLSLSGSYLSFKSFLSSLERTARLIETESIAFASPKEKPTVPTQGGPFSFSLKIKFYSY